MKELIDNTHSGAYSPQSHSDSHINTHSAALKLAYFTTTDGMSSQGGNRRPAARGRTKIERLLFITSLCITTAIPLQLVSYTRPSL